MLRSLGLDDLTKRRGKRSSEDIGDEIMMQIYVVVVAIWAVFIAFIIDGHVLTKRFFAFFAHESHLHCFGKWMTL